MSVSALTPRVAIVILQWRRADETAACLRSVAALDYANYTVLVVDNHSGDGSLDRNCDRDKRAGQPRLHHRPDREDMYRHELLRNGDIPEPQQHAELDRDLEHDGDGK